VIPTYIAIGAVGGILAGIFGIGGGIVIVPALVFFAKMSQKTATGTSLGALLLPVGALGVYAYWREGHLDMTAAVWVALGLFVGTLGGAWLAQALSDATLKRAFAVLLLIVAMRLWVSS
jgi:uncharacterized membrane protein YfcA